MTGRIQNRNLALERILPNSLESEMAVLGAMLLDPVNCAAQVIERIEQKHFYYAAHQVIFREFCKIQDAMMAVDVITLGQRLRDKNLLDEIGGDGYLMDLISRVPTTSNVEHYMEIVMRDYVRRQIIGHSHDAMVSAFENPELPEWLPQFQQTICDIGTDKRDQQILPFSEHAKATLEHVIEWREKPGAVSGLSTGLIDVDKILGGLKPGQVIVFAGRPGHGKSSLAVEIAAFNALLGNPAAIFSLEMTASELSDRTIVGHAGVNLRTIQSGAIKDFEFEKIEDSVKKYSSASLFIDDTADLKISQIRARARRLRLKFGIKLIVIDYIQLAHSDGRHEKREAEVAEVSRGCKAMAKELGVPVIAVAQLNRSADNEGQRPKLSALRESGQIEADADVVGFLVRPELFEEDEEKQKLLKGRAMLSILKQRGGPTGDVSLTFRAELTRFENEAKVTDEDVSRARRVVDDVQQF